MAGEKRRGGVTDWTGVGSEVGVMDLSYIRCGTLDLIKSRPSIVVSKYFEGIGSAVSL